MEKLYQVFEKMTQTNDFGESTVSKYPLGYSRAKSAAKAISNVKFQKGIKKRNKYDYDDYTCNVRVDVEFIAEEVKEDAK